LLDGDQVPADQAPQGAARRRLPVDWEILCGSVVQYSNGTMDLFCWKNLDKDFVLMLLFVVSMTGGVVLYAAL
jgi:hypothetical protein